LPPSRKLELCRWNRRSEILASPFSVMASGFYIREWITAAATLCSPKTSDKRVHRCQQSGGMPKPYILRRTSYPDDPSDSTAVGADRSRQRSRTGPAAEEPRPGSYGRSLRPLWTHYLQLDLSHCPQCGDGRRSGAGDISADLEPGARFR